MIHRQDSTHKDGVVDVNLVTVVPALPSSSQPQILFESRFIALALVLMKNGQRMECVEPLQRLLTVVKGRVRLRGPNGSFVLQDHGRWRLTQGEQWKIRALSDASVSLLIVKHIV